MVRSRRQPSPWETLNRDVKVKEGSGVVFDDEFNSGATIEPGPKENPSGGIGVGAAPAFGPRDAAKFLVAWLTER